MKITSRIVIFTVVASLVVGAGAGVVASIATSNALEDYAAKLLGDRGFTALEPRKPNTNPLDYAEALRRVRDAQARSTAVIAAKTSDSQLSSNWIGGADADGLGTVVSANGWVLTTADALEDFADPVMSAEVWIRGARYAISEVQRDSLTKYVLLKLAAASGLPAAGFGTSEDMRTGDMVFVVTGVTGLAATTIQNGELQILDEPQLAEAFTTGWELTGADVSQGPVLSSTGDVLGFLLSDGTVTPLHHGAAFVQETIRNGAPAHAALGAYTVDLSHVYNLDPDIRQGFSAGALVSALPGKLAVPVGTPADAAGLLAEDIITAVDGEAVTPATSLAEILTTYDPGQTARLSVVRSGAPIEIQVVLGDADALVY